jgi:hypothetical protein
MADMREQLNRDSRAIQEQLEEATVLGREKARTELQEQLEKLQREGGERMSELEAKLKKVEEGVVNEGRVISDLHEDDRMKKYP